MADDIVNRLRSAAKSCKHGFPNGAGDSFPDPTYCGGCLRLNDAVDEIELLRAEVQSQTFWAELMAGNNCYCSPDDIGICAPCAYRQTMRQNEEASRG